MALNILPTLRPWLEHLLKIKLLKGKLENRVLKELNSVQNSSFYSFAFAKEIRYPKLKTTFSSSLFS